MRSVMKHTFSQVPSAKIPRSAFNRSHGYKTTFDAGYLVPILVDEALPGDTLSLRVSAFARLATPLKPFMDNLFMDTFFFAVPYRLVWNNWEKFNGQQDNPDDSTDYLIPTQTSPNSTGYTVGSLQDYMGIPTDVDDLVHSALPLRAYNLIYNEWFRDENLQDSVVVDKDDGPDSPSDYVLLRRGKRHDYFTSCLPWPQKGPSVPLPLGTYAPITSIANNGIDDPSVNGRIFVKSALGSYKGFLSSDAQGSDNYITVEQSLWSSNDPNELLWQQQGDFAGSADTGWNVADLSEATAATINSLREAFQLQRLYERDARGGTRYTEIIRSHFGVVSPDARLQRPEYLGGGSSVINVHPIAQTSASETNKPQGNLAAMGTAAIGGHGFTKSFTEHCIIIGLVNVRADLNYQQGLNRMWSRSTRWDFYWPALSHIGEQAVLVKELWAQGQDVTTDDEVFGYQERYAEYRYKPSQITGQFRSTYSSSLDIWHLAQEFSAKPELNAAFIVDDPPVDRVIATPTEPHFLFDSYMHYNCVRPMPVYSVPGLIDHF